MKSREEFINGLPKAELHIHIEGSFEPELMFSIAERNKIRTRFKSEEDLKAAYRFNNLQEFLDIYYEGAGVLQEEEDFYDLTKAYLSKCIEQKVIHTEIFFDPQTHTSRGVPFATVINGITRALNDSRENISSLLIMCFLRHLSQDDAIKTFKESLPYRDKFIAVGLDSSEVGNPPSKFERVFEMARGEGLITVAHAGEEGPSQYIHEALDLLRVARIDHGNRCLDDNKLMERISSEKIPLTLCPLSNVELKVVNDLRDYPLREMLQQGIVATLNSDDPAYFGGYVNENFIAVANAVDLNQDELTLLAKNSIEASFLDDAGKQAMKRRIDQYVALS